jgi:hypothetical protein
MAVSIVQSDSSDAGGIPTDTVTVTMGSSPVVGNLLIAAVAYFVAGAGPPITPSGWTEEQREEPTDAGLVVYSRKVPTGLGTNQTFTTTGADYIAAAVYEVSGQHPTAPFNQKATANNNASSHTTASATPNTIGCLGLVFLTTDEAAGSGADTATVSAGWTINERPYPLFHALYGTTRDARTTDRTTAVNATFSSLHTGPNTSSTLLIAPSLLDSHIMPTTPRHGRGVVAY